MKRLLYLLCQWSWGLPQTLVGALFYFYYRQKGCRRFRYQGAFVVIWTKEAGSMSLGCFLFLHPDWTAKDRALLEHEYGHTIQSLICGPLYLLAVGLPSLLWAGLPVFQRHRRTRGISYYAVYPEKQASSLGERFAKKMLPSLPVDSRSKDGGDQAL
ncbi:MAG: hypothetical protein J5878_04520 [Oscillospiraceae bacterium]|nr:hypothetical protein [Oscillospiraceae bacterium]